MIRITSIDKQGNTVSLTAAHPVQAAGIAGALAATARFLKIEQDGWTLLFPATVHVSGLRLAHIIKHRANVVLQ